MNKIFNGLMIFFLAAWIMPAASQTPIEYAFYVAPGGDDNASGNQPKNAFATLTKARDAIRDLKEKGPLDRPVTVYLMGGLYSMRQPLTLEPQDSGAEEFPITYTAAKNEKPVLSGGKTITGWKSHTGSVWSAELPEVRRGEWNFRQLFVNGEPRQRARIPNEGFFRVAGFPDGGRDVHYHTDCQRFEFAEGDMDPDWSDPEDIEVIVYHFWTDSHLPIQSIDPETNIVTFKHKAGKVFTDDFTDAGARYVVENVYEGLDQPGEWHLNRKTGVIYYIPMPGEDMNKVEVVAPVLPAFISMQGKPESREFVEHVHVRDLSFRYANFNLPPGNSNDRQGSASVPAAITLTGARHCAFERCTMENIGTFAFEIADGCSHNRFAFNDIHHIGAGGFRVNGGTENDHPLKRTGHNQITDNILHHYGEVFPSAVGVLLQNTNANLVAHNHIHHGWYTGVSIGWCWGYQRSVSRDNIVEYNHIHDIGQGLLSDMGAIYTLGVSPGTVLRNNLIHDVDANHYGGWGIYNDEGSTHLLIENNVVYNTKFAGYNIHFCKEVTVRNNIFALGRLQQLSRSRCEPHESVYFENNIVYWKEGVLLDNNWKDEPYEFYFRPIGDSGTREVKNTFDMDWNIFYNPGLKLEQVEFNGASWEEWRGRGKDLHSLYADPLFVDPDGYDFTLKPESPAFDLGFQPIDMSTVGPRSIR
ncbi:MAG: right-handed parallel beta-helix repeat-containing protein [Candidatus Omnitrophica bacterium]|nr:right-handed parallel beta-helix repeat-containing protein [Candidatus Omnitrophota bacterium]